MRILPDSSNSIVVEVGKNFTATCHLQEGFGYTTDDIEWSLEDDKSAKLSVHKINETSVSVTFNVKSGMSGWLRCRAVKKSLSYVTPCIYGILLDAGSK